MSDAYLGMLSWLADPAQWSGPTSIPARTGIYLAQCAATLVLASAVALPVGLWIGHTGRCRALVVPLTSAMRSLPTLGMLLLISLWLGIGLNAPLLALSLLAIPPILSGAYAGIESIDPQLTHAARSVGFTEWQVLIHVEIPLGLPVIVSGLRAASVQILATWTVAAYLPIEGLGRYLIDGLAMQDYVMMLAGSAIIIFLEIIINAAFGLAEHLAIKATHRR